MKWIDICGEPGDLVDGKVPAGRLAVGDIIVTPTRHVSIVLRTRQIASYDSLSRPLARGSSLTNERTTSGSSRHPLGDHVIQEHRNGDSDHSEPQSTVLRSSQGDLWLHDPGSIVTCAMGRE